MKHMKKKLLSTLLVLCMVLALLPGTAWAGGDTSWAISIVYDKNYNTETISADQTTPLSGKGWSYKPDSNTLILDGFDGYQISFYDGDETVGNFTLELRGTNKLSGLSFGSVKSRSVAATATITGSGSIELDYLKVNNINVVMKGGTITTSGRSVSENFGVGLVNCTFRMTGGTLNAIGSRYGIYVDPATTTSSDNIITINDKIILEGGTVTAYGDYAAIWIQEGYNSTDKTVLGADNILDFGGRTPVGGNDESDRQILSVKDVKKELPNPLPDGTTITRTEYIISLTSGKLTPGTATVYWEKEIGAAKYAYISGAGQTTTPSNPSTPPSGVFVTVKGKEVEWTDAKPFVDKNDRTMVPLRAVAEALDLTVNWDDKAFEASFTDGTKTIYFPINSKNARTSEGGTVKMDTAAINKDGRSYAPIRYLAEYFGYTVGWDGPTSTVSIT